MAVVGSPVPELRTPTAERPSGEELVTEGLLPSSGEENVAVVGRYHDLDGGGRWTKRISKTDNGC